MPDIKTAFNNAFYKAPDIQKVIAEWDDTEAQPVATKIQEKQMPYAPQTDTHDMTISEIVFNFIKDNPLKGRAQIVNELHKHGYKESSVNTLISQSVLCGTVHRNDSGLHTVTSTRFKPVTQNMVLKARRVKQKNNVGIAALKQQPRVEKEPTSTPRFETMAMMTSNTSALPTQPTDIDALLNSLTFNQAIGLYKKLKTMLGEV